MAARLVAVPISTAAVAAVIALTVVNMSTAWANSPLIGVVHVRGTLVRVVGARAELPIVSGLPTCPAFRVESRAPSMVDLAVVAVVAIPQEVVQEVILQLPKEEIDPGV